MRRRYGFLAASLLLLVLASGACAAPSWMLAQDRDKPAVSLNRAEGTKLNTFLSNFSEAGLRDYDPQNTPEEELIAFAILHNLVNNPKLFRPVGDQVALPAAKVDATLQKYLGRRVRHRSLPNWGITYDGSRYLRSDTDRDACPHFSQVVTLLSEGNGVFVAYANIHESPEEDATRECYVPRAYWPKGFRAPVVGSLRAVIRTVTENGKTRYILLQSRTMNTKGLVQ